MKGSAVNRVQEDLLERFLATHSDGSPRAYDLWAEQQVELRRDPVALVALRSIVVDLHGSEQRSAESPTAPTARVFQRSASDPLPLGPDPSLANGTPKEGMQVGPFVLIRFLARGGMGQVWEAQDTSLRRKVALKFVLPERLDRRALDLFVREARAGARLVHPNLVTTLAHGEDLGLSWIAQELVDGSWTLSDFLEEVRTSGKLPTGYSRHVAEFIAQLADGLQAAHEAGVIHRDVKPRNILIASDDRPKLTDFGLARVHDDSFASNSGELLGTWSYMSPEQVTAKRMGLDHRTDVFSLGVVLYEMLALRRPFEGETTHQIAERIVTFEPPNLNRVRSGCPRELATICSKALEKAPGRRYQLMSELAEDLRAFLASRPIRAKRPSLARRVSKFAKERPIPFVLVGTLVSSVVLAGAFVMAMQWVQKTPGSEGGNFPVLGNEVLAVVDSGAAEPAIESSAPASVASQRFMLPEPLGELERISRANWGAKEPVVSRIKVSQGGYTKITLHHTADIRGTPLDGSLASTFAASRAVQEEHMGELDWGDIGYHFLIDSVGRLIDARSLEFMGAHAGGENNMQNIGVCFIGNYVADPPSRASLETLTLLLSELRSRFQIPANEVFSHNFFKATNCPGPVLTKWATDYRAAGPSLQSLK
ncbi:MAG: serine/threonine protein kinase [Candidatus Paceibacteria bacterium]|jgi:serine/threonine protein kinase